ncbi:hypothetical protein [Exiguobacterium sp. 8H]|uniref:hypothetical protein n=1 Tax=Exiguobacterium sp. 8H TaxID=2653140 RepID=UPI00135B40A2|nr:hypothetical protein [Exiguobacterium sp. 8H]
MRRPKRESVQKMFGFCALFDLGDWKNHVKSAMIKVNLGWKNQIHQSRMVRASTRSVQPSVASSESDLAAASPTKPYGLVGFFVFWIFKVNKMLFVTYK